MCVAVFVYATTRQLATWPLVPADVLMKRVHRRISSSSSSSQPICSRLARMRVPVSECANGVLHTEHTVWHTHPQHLHKCGNKLRQLLLTQRILMAKD